MSDSRRVGGQGAVQGRRWRYSRTAIVLHWLLAILLTLTTLIGWRMKWIEHQPGSAQWFDLHKSIGVVIAVLVAVRVGWRLTHRPEPLPPGPRWQARFAGIAHGLLYVLMVALPITGYLGASYSKAGVRWFGIETPRWVAPDHATAELFFDAHGVLLWTTVVLVLLHVAGALKHLLVDKDEVFQRMWRPRQR
jgi:cytochrome b561